MEKFAGYGFNKSHAAAYALIAYQTAYFKAHHPAAFMAANLSLVMDDTDKVRALYDDAVANGLAILPPDVNASNYRFEPIDASASATASAASRAPARRRSRRSSRRATRADRSRPVRFLPARRQARRQSARRRGADPRRRVRRDRAAPRHAVRLGRRRARRGGEGGGVRARRCRCSARAASRPGSRSSPTREWTEAERLAHEKAALGFYLSGHPYAAYAAELAPLIRQPLSDLQPKQEPVLDRRHRHRAAHADRAGAARWRSSRSTTAPGSAEIVVFNETFDARAQSAARGPARRRRGQDHAAQRRRRPGAGPARRRRGRLRPRGHPQAPREGCCASRATAAPMPRGSPSCSRRSATAAARSSSSTATTGSSASSSCPGPGTSPSTTRCSRS